MYHIIPNNGGDTVIGGPTKHYATTAGSRLRRAMVAKITNRVYAERMRQLGALCKEDLEGPIRGLRWASQQVEPNRFQRIQDRHARRMKRRRK